MLALPIGFLATSRGAMRFVGSPGCFEDRPTADRTIFSQAMESLRKPIVSCCFGFLATVATNASKAMWERVDRAVADFAGIGKQSVGNAIGRAIALPA